MGHQFKPGDLALIVGCYVDPSDIGKVVELQELLHEGQEFSAAGWDHLCYDGPGLGWVCLSDDVVDSTGLSGFVVVDPKHLMPLRDDFAPAQQKAREVESC
jgi:hypothetical protein